MFKHLALAAAVASSVTMIPTAAQARHSGYADYQGYQQSYRGARYADNRYYGRNQYVGANYRSCKSGTTGAIVGGAGGALLGRQIAGRADRTIGTILGAAVGALAGREITRTKNCYR